MGAVESSKLITSIGWVELGWRIMGWDELGSKNGPMDVS